MKPTQFLEMQSNVNRIGILRAKCNVHASKPLHASLYCFTFAHALVTTLKSYSHMETVKEFGCLIDAFVTWNENIAARWCFGVRSQNNCNELPPISGDTFSSFILRSTSRLLDGALWVQCCFEDVGSWVGVSSVSRNWLFVTRCAPLCDNVFWLPP